MESSIVNVIGSHKFSVVFGIGDQKFSTSWADDPSGCPTWNEQREIHIENQEDPLIFVVREKNSTLGQVEVPIEFIPRKDCRRVTSGTLEVHKKCPNPFGILAYDAWIIKKDVGNLSAEKSPKPGKKSPLMRLKNQLKSPGTTVGGLGGSLRPLKKDDNGNLVRSRKKSVSLTDLRNAFSSKEDSKPLEKSGRTPSFVFSFSMRSPRSTVDNNAPVITNVSPNEGSCLGGTMVTFEGENLGTDQDDIIVFEIGGCDCLQSVKYISSKKVLVTTKPHKPGEGQVTIKTLSGGKGTSGDCFQFLNDAPSSFKKKNSFWQGETYIKKDTKYVTILEDELDKLRKENEELKCVNADMLEYIDRVVGRLMNEYPDALAVPETSEKDIVETLEKDLAGSS